ncbi:MAG: hypothetical protein HZC40_17330 [Chloroflexi bacterium]|nr:hypothetical protein [Chloroflexota bacterium]
MSNLKSCPYRLVDNEGHILCDKIKTGDRAISLETCRVCPIAAINCGQLRAALDHQTRPPITVRYGNGRSEVWDNVAPAIALRQAACATKVVPIHSPRDCAGCALRQPLVIAESAQAATTARAPAIARRQPRVIAPMPVAPPQPIAQPVATIQPTPDARSTVVHQKIIQLQEWLAKQKTIKPLDDDEDTVRPIAVAQARPMRVREEKRAGWTD